LLSDVIRFLAMDCEISFFSLTDGSPEGEKLITFSLTASPFQALETLCKANSLALVIDGGIWYIRPADDRELFGRAYEVKHNAFEKVTKSNSNSNDSSGGGGGNSTSGGSSSGGGFNGSSGGSTGGTQSGGIDLQGARDTFRTQKSELVNDIRAILDLPLEADNSSGGSGSSSFSGPAVSGSDVTSSGAPTDVYGSVRKPKVIWKSDSNTLYVVATRLQHMWVEGYLSAADKPQPQIAIEVKFFETSRDPSSEFGLDWTGTFGSQGNFRKVDSVVTDPTTGVSTVSTTNVPTVDGGYRTDLANLLSIGDLAKTGQKFGAPMAAVLSAQDVNVKLRALLNDSQTRSVSYPRMVTTNNREVVLRSVINQPVLGGSSSTSVTGGAATTAAISYLPIGTVINILPKKMMNDKVNLNIAITVSSIISTTFIQGNPYPVASSRVYSAPVEVSGGYTVAIGGLDEAKEQVTDQGIPVVNKIPLFGWLFKTQTKSKNHKNLMLFITPSLIDDKGGGLSNMPEAVLPRKPDALMPKVPRLTSDGGLQGGVEALPNAILFLRRSTQEIGQIITENRGTRDEYAKISDLTIAIRRLRVVVDKYGAQYPAQAEELKQYRWELGKMLDDLERERMALAKKGYY
ncbi:MAG: hypothetical protein K8R87_02735, partial [Verrucomicrobia bacterium]|nr:hypothetical protein [Verrucomicrobiota bacterium]